jgi:hypothetical protein
MTISPFSWSFCIQLLLLKTVFHIAINEPPIDIVLKMKLKRSYKKLLTRIVLNNFLHCCISRFPHRHSPVSPSHWA